jgi:hypothetical protein
MKRTVLCGLGVSVVLALGLVGCGSAGVDTGVPTNPPKEEASTADPLKGFMGKMGTAAARAAAADAAKAKKASPSEPPAKPQ